MLQDLPLNYPTIITKYLQARLDAGEFEVPDDADVLLSGFDRVDFKGVTYEFDLYEDDELVRITNLTTNVLYNVTKYDGREDYHTLPDLLGVLDYIESNTVFTVSDWIQTFTETIPVYTGLLFNLYTVGDNEHIVQLNKAGTGFYIKDNRVVYLADITLGLKVEEPLYTANITNEINGLRDDIPSCQYTHDTLRTILDAEYRFTKVESSGMLARTITVNARLFTEMKVVNIFGIGITIDNNIKTITFENGGRKYQVGEAGHLTVTDVSEMDVTQANRTGMLFRTGFMRINTQEEIGAVRTICNLLENLFNLAE